MKKLLSALLIVTLALTSVFALTACSNSANSAGDNATEAPANASSVTIAIPNDTTNEARALLLLQELGYIKLKADAGITATPRDIEDNPKNIEFAEIEAAQLPSALKDYDYAVINSNYAIDAGLNPVKDSLGIEGSASAYVNIIAVKAGNENEPKIKALVAATESKKVVDYINENYDGAVVPVVENPTDTPHAEILAIVKDILAEKDITLKITEFTDYVQPNLVVDNGELDANYFQHVPYLDDFNAENGTSLVSVAGIHVEPIGLYGGKQSSLDALK